MFFWRCLQRRFPICGVLHAPFLNIIVTADMHINYELTYGEKSEALTMLCGVAYVTSVPRFCNTPPVFCWQKYS
jgi:hypothetical protein